MDDTASASASFRRRTLLQSMLGVAGGPALAVPTTSFVDDDDGSSTAPIVRGEVIEIRDPNGYSAVAYIPPSSDRRPDPSAIETLPLLLVLHGAGRNRHSALYEFTQGPTAANTSSFSSSDDDDAPGDHIHLPPYLLSAHEAPSSLSDNFVVVAPYVGKDKRSLYDDPRADILSFLAWFCDRWIEHHTFVDIVDIDIADSVAAATPPRPTGIRLSPRKRYLFGFSEGATLAVELVTTRRFRGAILASYGFRGRLPRLALERLRGVAVWAYHSKGDDVYDVRCSEELVESLLLENGGGGGGNDLFWMEGGDRGGMDAFGMNDIVKLTKLVPLEKEKRKNNAGTVEMKGREHIRAAIVASQSEEVYSWLLSLP